MSVFSRARVVCLEWLRGHVLRVRCVEVSTLVAEWVGEAWVWGMRSDQDHKKGCAHTRGVRGRDMRMGGSGDGWAEGVVFRMEGLDFWVGRWQARRVDWLQ